MEASKCLSDIIPKIISGTTEAVPKRPSRLPIRRVLRVEQFFSAAGVHPFDQLEWEVRSAKILDDNGQTIFEQNNIEVPTTWSQLATKVVASKYFYGDIESDQREHSVKQLVHRVCRTIAERGKRDGYFAGDEDAENFYNELTWLCVNQYGAFNSPVWFNVGLFDVCGVAGSRHNFRWDQPAQESCCMQ